MPTPFQSMTAVANVYTLPRCDVSLRVAGDDGSAGSEIWAAKQVDNLRIAEWFDEVTVPTTGIPYPEVHHTTEHHEITFDAIWNLQATLLSRPVGGPQTGRNTKYSLVITWTDAALGNSGNHWYRRIYYGVKLPRRTISSRDGNEFGSENVLKAQKCDETQGDGSPS